MKKFLTTILAIVYLTASTGATVHMHYCMGKLVNWDLLNRQNPKCGVCGMEKKGHEGCCKDEHKIIKIEKDQKVSGSGFEFPVIFSDVVAPAYTNLLFGHTSSIIADNPTAHAPPRRLAAIFVLNCNFRI